MEDDGDYMEDDNFYPSDFEDDASELVGVKEFLQGVHEGGVTSVEDSTFQETYFLSSNGDSDFEEEDGGDEILEPWENLIVNGVEHINVGTPSHSHDFTSSLFEDIPIETFPTYVHFTLQSITLMVDCIRRAYFPSFQQIQEANPLFCPLSKDHGRLIETKFEAFSIERWKKLKMKLKVVEVLDGFALSPSYDEKNRQIPPIEYWHSIVHRGHVDENGKHRSFSLTKDTIRTQWSTDLKVGGIHASFIQNCINSCEVCQEKKIWDEVVIVPLEDLSVTLDSICTKHIVLRRRFKRRIWQNKTVTYYHCHRGGSKSRAHRKTIDGKPKEEKNSRRDRTSRLCNCEFQIKVVEPNQSKSSSSLSQGKLEGTIYVHSEHSGHTPGSDADSFFLPVHPLVIGWVMENLKLMLSPRALEAMSVDSQDAFSQSVPEVDRVTYRFFIIKKEVQLLAYSLRVNGMCFNLLLYLIYNSIKCFI